MEIKLAQKKFRLNYIKKCTPFPPPLPCKHPFPSLQFFIMHLLLIFQRSRIERDGKAARYEGSRRSCIRYKYFLEKKNYLNYGSFLPQTTIFSSLYLSVKSRGDDSSLPVCSVSCTVHLHLFTNNGILQVRPK